MPPMEAITRAKFAFGFAILNRYKKWSGPRIIWEAIKYRLGFANSLPEAHIVQWKPIYLPVWSIDYAGVFKARYQEEVHGLEFSAPDIPLPGTDVHPFAALSPVLPARESLQDLLEPFSSAHIRVYKDDAFKIDGETTPPAMPVPFSVFPMDLPERAAEVLGNIRHDEIRFPGENETSLLAAYPIYMPYYLLSIRDLKKDDDAVPSTVLMTGHSQLSSVKDVGFRFWDEEEKEWVPDQGSSFNIELKAYRRSRPVTNVPQTVSDADDSEGTLSSRLRSFSPRAAAQAAADSGSFDGAPHRTADGKLTAVGSILSGLEFKRGTETAANLINEQFQYILRQTLLQAEKLPTDATVKEVEERMKGYPNLMAFTKHAEQNLVYMEKYSELQTAKQGLAHAKAMPKLPTGSDQKVLTIAPKTRGFGVDFKSMDSAGLEKMRKDAIDKAEEVLSKAKEEADACRPAWLSQVEKTQH